MFYMMAEADGGGSAGAGGEQGEAPGEPVEQAAAAAEGGGDGETKTPVAREDGRNAKGQFAKPDGTNKGDPPPKFKTTVRVKYKGADGKEIEQDEEVDEDRLKRSYMVERGLRMKAEETAKTLAEKDRAIADLQARWERGVREDSRHILPEDVNPVEWHAQQLERYLAEHAQDPKDRQIAQLKGQLAETVRKERERQQQEEAARQRRDAAQLVEHIGRSVIPLIEKTGLPKNDLFLERAVKYYWSTRRQGIEDPDPEIIAEEVVNEFTGSLEALADKLDGEVALKKFPKLSTKIAGALRERYKKAQSAANPPAPKKTAEEREAARNGGQAPRAEQPQQRRVMNDKELDKHFGIRS